MVLPASQAILWKGAVVNWVGTLGQVLGLLSARLRINFKLLESSGSLGEHLLVPIVFIGSAAEHRALHRTPRARARAHSSDTEPRVRSSISSSPGHGHGHGFLPKKGVPDRITALGIPRRRSVPRFALIRQCVGYPAGSSPCGFGSYGDVLLRALMHFGGIATPWVG